MSQSRTAGPRSRPTEGGGGPRSAERALPSQAAGALCGGPPRRPATVHRRRHNTRSQGAAGDRHTPAVPRRPHRHTGHNTTATAEWTTSCREGRPVGQTAIKMARQDDNTPDRPSDNANEWTRITPCRNRCREWPLSDSEHHATVLIRSSRPELLHEQTKNQVQFAHTESHRDII